MHYKGTRAHTVELEAVILEKPFKPLVNLNLLILRFQALHMRNNISLGLWYSLLKISIDIQGYYIPECHY
jgi:hypothetical protein